MNAATNPLAAFQAYHNHVTAMKIDRVISVTGTVTTLTGGTKDNRIHAILLDIHSPRGFRLAKPVLAAREGLATAAKVVVTRDNARFGGRVRIQMFAADGSEMYGEFIAVGPRGGISA